LESRAERSEMKTSMGFVGQDWTWCLKPWWYYHQHSVNTKKERSKEEYGAREQEERVSRKKERYIMK
jgi:hypothetical protein